MNLQSVFRLRTLDRSSTGDAALVAALWNAACGPDLAITDRGARYNMLPVTNGLQVGCVAMAGDEPAGFVLASVHHSAQEPRVAAWIDALAVHPDARRRGVGSRLLAWAEDWLITQGATRVRLGGSLRPFTAGLPVELGTLAYFEARDYAAPVGGGRDWDVARSLRHFAPTYKSSYAHEVARIAPVQRGEEEALLAFLAREFAGRWYFECREHLAAGGRSTDFMALWVGDLVQGSCVLTFEDSLQPLDRFFMHRLSRPWGQLGSIGIAAEQRGKGFGGLLLDGGLCQLRDSGVAGCVIDWTGLVDFYGKFGFSTYREYAMLARPLPVSRSDQQPIGFGELL